MSNEWSLRDEILVVTHRWPIILLYCLIGALLGWGISLGWSSPYRASKELYVGLDVSQASMDRNAPEHAGLVFYSISDYKNWQMASLNSLVFMDSVINETLERLQMLDGYWTDVAPQQLAGMLHIYWRNAGKWELVAESDNPLRASQAVVVWQDVVVERVNHAVKHSQDTMVLDRQLQSINATQTQVISRTAELNQIRETLNAWQTNTSQYPTDQPLGTTERWALLSLLTNANLSAAWEPLLATFPPEETPLREYSDWIEKIRASLDMEISIMQTQIDSLETEKQAIAAQYAEASQKSLGLSPELVVDNITDAQPIQNVVRPTGLLMLIGSLFGLITWAIVWLVNISLRATT